MTAGLDPLALSLGAGAALAGGGVWLYGSARRARANSRRIADIVLAYTPPSAPALSVRRPWTERSGTETLSARALSALGIDAERPDLYPMPWWVIVPITIAVAVAVEGLSEFFLGAIVWIGLPVVWFLIARAIFGVFRGRRAGVLYAQLPDALSMITRSVRAGITVQDALRVVSEEGQWPTSTEFQRLTDEIRVGASLPEAIARLARRSALIEYRFLAVALTLQSQSGGSLAETLENLADVVRKRVAVKQRAIALASEARLTMWVLGCLPFVAAGALLIISPDYLTVLVTTSTGKNILFAGILLLAMGFASMHAIIKKSVS